VELQPAGRRQGPPFHGEVELEQHPAAAAWAACDWIGADPNHLLRFQSATATAS